MRAAFGPQQSQENSPEDALQSAILALLCPKSEGKIAPVFRCVNWAANVEIMANVGEHISRRYANWNSNPVLHWIWYPDAAEHVSD